MARRSPVPAGVGGRPKNVFCVGGGAGILSPLPPGGGGRSKKCIWGWGGTGFCRPLPPGVGVVHQVYFWGWHQIFRLQPPPRKWGSCPNKCIGGGRVRRVLIAPTPRGNKRSPRHSAPSLTKNALASAPLRARSPCHSAPPVTKNALDSAPLRATPRHPLFPLGATKTGAPPPPKYTCLDDPHFRGVAGGRKSGAILQNTLLWRTPPGGGERQNPAPPPLQIHFFERAPPPGG